MLAILLSTIPAQAVFAAPMAEEAKAVRAACGAAFIARDAAAWQSAASTMLSWGEIADEALRREVELCLAYGDVIPGADLDAARAAAAAPDPQSVTEPVPAVDPKLASYLKRLDGTSPDMETLAADIAADKAFAPLAGPDRDRLEAALLAHVRPIPASRAQANLTAYEALARIDPENTAYGERIARYRSAIEIEKAALERTAKDLERRLIKTTEPFDGSSWSRHPSSPRYQDDRNYITLYLIDNGKGSKSMELFVNYTADDGWLFVESAQLNIDGAVSRLPVPRWFRDNDTEIWEFGSVTGPQALEIARKIANADRAVVRFNGQQFYDDFVVSGTDKKVLREMLAMWEVIGG